VIRRRHRAAPGSGRARYAESQGPGGIARAAAPWTNETFRLSNSRAPPGCAACGVAKADMKESAN